MDFQSLQHKITKESLKALFIWVTGFTDSPLGFCFFQPEVLGRGQRGDASLTGQIRRRWSPAARVEGRGSFTKSARTCSCPELGSGWPVAAARWEQAVGGGGERRRRRSNGHERRGKGRGASVRGGEARYGVNWSRGRSGMGAPRRAGGGGGC
jgi:hypothetical protein